MKKIICFLAFLFGSFGALAQQGPVIFDNEKFATEIESLGAMGGLAYACNIDTELKTYENIITDLIYNSSVSKQQEYTYKQLYLDAKQKFYDAHKRNPRASCKEIKEKFFNQKIFYFKKNNDGSMISPDGDIIKRGEALPY